MKRNIHKKKKRVVGNENTMGLTKGKKRIKELVCLGRLELALVQCKKLLRVHKTDRGLIKLRKMIDRLKSIEDDVESILCEYKKLEEFEKVKKGVYWVKKELKKIKDDPLRCKFVESCCTKLLGSFPDEDAELYLIRGSIYHDLGLLKKAMEDFNYILSMKNSSRSDDTLANMHFYKGLLYIDHKKWTLAISQINQALEEGIYDKKSMYFVMGICYHRLELYELSLEYLNRCLKGVKSYKEAFPKGVYLRRGYTYKEMGDYQKAKLDFQKHVKINPNCAEGYYGIANCIYMASNHQDTRGFVRKNLQKAIKIDGNHRSSHYLLGNISTNPQFSIQCWKKALSLEELEDPMLYYNIGLRYQEIGQLNLAIENYYKSVKWKPDYADAFDRIGECYSSLVQPGKAADANKFAFAIRNSANVY